MAENLADDQKADEESTAGKLFFKFSETRVPQVIRKVLEENGWHEWDPEKHPESLWSLHWKSGRFKLSDWDKCMPHQRINHCPKTSNITKKDNLHRNIKRLAGSYGSVYNFVPTTYVLPNEYVSFMREYAEQAEQEIWICKPSDSSRGRGIFLIRDMSDLIYDQPYIIQKYIKDPLTIGGFKFDLRLYVLVPTFHPMKAYLYDEGLVRFATEKYTCDQSTDLSNVYSHLTNSSINKFSPSLNENKAGIGPGCKWPLSRLLKYLDDRNMDTASIMQRIKNIIVLTLLAVWPKVPAQSSGFELLGFDVMLDSQLDPWLIEVNASPALATDTQLDMQVKAPLLSDTLKVLSIGPLPVDEKKSGRRPLSHPPPSSMNANNAASMRRASPSSSAGTTLPRSSLRPPGLQGGGATSTMGRSGGPPRDPRASMLRRGVGGGGGGNAVSSTGGGRGRDSGSPPQRGTRGSSATRGRSLSTARDRERGKGGEGGRALSSSGARHAVRRALVEGGGVMSKIGGEGKGKMKTKSGEKEEEEEEEEEEDDDVKLPPARGVGGGGGNGTGGTGGVGGRTGGVQSTSGKPPTAPLSKSLPKSLSSSSLLASSRQSSSSSLSSRGGGGGVVLPSASGPPRVGSAGSARSMGASSSSSSSISAASTERARVVDKAGGTPSSTSAAAAGGGVGAGVGGGRGRGGGGGVGGGGARQKPGGVDMPQHVPTKIGGYELIFPATPEMERLRNQACRGGNYELKPLVNAIKEVELAARRRGRIAKAETAKKQDEISTLLPKKEVQQGPWWMSN